MIFQDARVYHLEIASAPQAHMLYDDFLKIKLCLMIFVLIFD